MHAVSGITRSCHSFSHILSLQPRRRESAAHPGDTVEARGGHGVFGAAQGGHRRNARSPGQHVRSPHGLRDHPLKGREEKEVRGGLGVKARPVSIARGGEVGGVWGML